MTQEQKDLLLKDLCARLPHRPKIWFAESNSNDHLQSIWYDDLEGWQVEGDNLSAPVYAVKLYLYPIASMTEEQGKELEEIDPEFYSLICGNGDIYVSMDVCGYDWLNKNHFDYRGLIEEGLAIDATGLNIY